MITLFNLHFSQNNELKPLLLPEPSTFAWSSECSKLPFEMSVVTADEQLPVTSRSIVPLLSLILHQLHL
jgi:hypothetical protein